MPLKTVLTGRNDRLHQIGRNVRKPKLRQILIPKRQNRPPPLRTVKTPRMRPANNLTVIRQPAANPALAKMPDIMRKQPLPPIRKTMTPLHGRPISN